MAAVALVDSRADVSQHHLTKGRVGISAIGGLVCAAMLAAGYLNKRRCVGPYFDSAGRSRPDWRIRMNADLCYSDIQQLWLGRDIDLHVFPYVHGGIDAAGHLTGGSVEYPVLTGIVMWLAGIGSHNDGQFLAHNALMLTPFGIATAVVLFALAGHRAWAFVLAPALVMYAFLSWDLLPVACTAAGIAAMSRLAWSRRKRAVLACVCFAVGGAAKFYPLMFAAPVGMWLLWTGDEHDGREPKRRSALDMRGAAMATAAAASTWVIINAPFALAGFRGWWASFQFQWSRPIDLTTNSIWFWAGRPYTDPSNVELRNYLITVSTAATATGMLTVLVTGAVLTRRGRYHQYPWLQVSAAMLCAYLLLNKVHSPQYALWLLPFFVLLRIRTGWIIAYYLADLTIGIGFFRWQYLIVTGQPDGIFYSWPAQAVVIGVWGRAALLACLTIVFLTARSGIRPWAGARRIPPLATSSPASASPTPA